MTEFVVWMDAKRMFGACLYEEARGRRSTGKARDRNTFLYSSKPIFSPMHCRSWF